MRPLFKFIPRRFAKGFVDGTSIRVGTIGDFRKTELHQVGIGDSLEGRSIIHSGTANFQGESVAKDWFLSRMAKAGADIEARSVSASGNTFTNELPDAYAMSFSMEFSEEVWASMPSGDDGYDCVLKIGDDEPLARAIMEALGDEVSEVRVGRIKYKKLTTTLTEEDGSFPSRFHKDLAFQDQKEFRFLFPTNHLPIEPKNVRCAIPAGLVRIYKER